MNAEECKQVMISLAEKGLGSVEKSGNKFTFIKKRLSCDVLLKEFNLSLDEYLETLPPILPTQPLFVNVRDPSTEERIHEETISQMSTMEFRNLGFDRTLVQRFL
jgi:hypothetical protein